SLGAPTNGIAAVCSQVAVGPVGLVSLKVIRKPMMLGLVNENPGSPKPPKDNTVPPFGVPLNVCSLFQFTPIEGSPQLSPNPGGGITDTTSRYHDRDIPIRLIETGCVGCVDLSRKQQRVPGSLVKLKTWR